MREVTASLAVNDHINPGHIVRPRGM